MCKYCEKGNKIEEYKNDNIYFEICGKHFRINGSICSFPFFREVIINYCPMCGRKLGD